jgi:hypothetical protein
MLVIREPLCPLSMVSRWARSAGCVVAFWSLLSLVAVVGMSVEPAGARLLQRLKSMLGI